MFRWFPRLFAPLALTLLLASGAVAADQEDQLQRLKLMQQRILMSEPAERAEQRERFEAWRKKMKQAVARGTKAGARMKPLIPRTDVGGPAARSRALASPAQLSSIQTPTNVRANDPTGEPDGACQSEVCLAAQGSHVVATWNDGIGIYGAPWPPDTQGFGYSSDGGLTWTDGGPIPNDGTFTWSSDPVVVLDEKTGEFFFSALIDAAGGANGVAVIKGSFCGNTFSWGPPVVVRTYPNASNLIDKEWLAADSLTGNLYLSFSNFLIVGGQAVSNSIQFTRSTDRGQTWTTPQTLSANADAGLVQGSRPAVGPDGEVYVVWYTIGQSTGPDKNSPFGRDFLRIRKSTDDGATFAASVTADSLFSNFSSGAPGFNRGIGITFPGIAVDRSDGPNRGRVYVTWNESLNFFNDPFPTPGTDPAQSEIEPNDAAANATAFAPGTILRGVISRTGTPTVPGDLDYWKWDAVQGQTVIFYLDSLASSLDAALRIFCSDGVTNLGFSQNGTGGADLLVFTPPTTATYYLRVASYTGTTLGKYRVLTTLNTPQNDRARDQRDIFVKSSPNGATWGPTVRVNDDPPYYDDWLPEVQVDGKGHVFVADYDWRDSPALCGGGSNAYLYRSDDGGINWTPGARMSDVTTNWNNGITYSTLIPNQGDYIGLIAADSTVHVAWGDGRLGSPDVFLATPTPSTNCVQSPVCLVDTTVTRTQITVLWSAPSGFTAELLRSTDGAPYVDIAPVTANAGNQISYQDNTVTSGHVYLYALSGPSFCQQLSGVVAATPVCDQSAVSVAGTSIASDTLTVTWTAPQGLQATLFRSVGSGPFVDLGPVTADANNQIVYVDIGVAPGQTYTYRLGVTGYCQPYVGQVSATVPGTEFGIASVHPNPTKGGDVVVSFSIDPTQPATLALIDISGRQVKKVNVSCASMPCVVNLTQGDRPKSGLYFVRLEQRGRKSVRRVSIFP